MFTLNDGWFGTINQKETNKINYPFETLLFGFVGALKGSGYGCCE